MVFIHKRETPFLKFQIAITTTTTKKKQIQLIIMTNIVWYFRIFSYLNFFMLRICF